VNDEELTMPTAIYNELTEQEKREVRMFGATRDQVQEAVSSYLTKGTRPKQIVTDMLMSAWREANFGELEDARQTLNRVKITIQRFYCGPERGFFFESEGEAYSILSDAQQLMEYDDIVRAKTCIDTAARLISTGGNIRG
jgi:hypothetical protein